MWTGILAVAILTAALAGVIAERRIERARTATHLQTVGLDDDFDHLIARLESDSAVPVRAPAAPEGRHQRPARRRGAGRREPPKEKGL